MEAKVTWRQMLRPVAIVAVGVLLWWLGLGAVYGSTMFIVRWIGILLAIYGIVMWARIAPPSHLMTWGALFQLPFVVNAGPLLNSSMTLLGFSIPIVPMIGIALIIAGFTRWARGEDSWLTRRY